MANGLHNLSPATISFQIVTVGNFLKRASILHYHLLYK